MAKGKVKRCPKCGSKEVHNVMLSWIKGKRPGKQCGKCGHGWYTRKLS